MRLHLSAVRYLTVLSCFALSACLPAAPDASRLAEQTMRRIVLGRQDIVMASGHSLDSLSAAFAAPIFRLPNAPEDELRACIEVTHRGVAARLHLVTNDLGGPNHDVMGYTLTDERDPGCVVGTPPIALSTEESLQLGMSWNRTTTLLDTPPVNYGDSLVYFRSVSQLDASQGASPRPYDAFTRVVVRLRNGRLWEYTVWYGEVD